MPQHLYVDFSAKDLLVIKAAVGHASNALVKAKAALAKPVYNAVHITELETRFKRWFGPFTPANVATVDNVITPLRNAICVGKLWIKSCQLNENLGTVAAPDIACPPGENASAVTSAAAVGFFASRNKVGYQNAIYVCPRMIHNMAAQGTERQNIAGTLIHEISHAVGGTDDVTQNGAVVYGAEAAKALARNPAGALGGLTALNNAENYGFFCMEFLDIVR